MLRTLVYASCTALAASAAWAQEPPLGIEMTDASGNSVESVSLFATPNGVLLAPSLTGLPSGPHGFHIHETGECDAAGGFESAGGLYAPEGNSHGYEVEGGPHAGDMPNQYVAADGKLQAEVFNPRVSLGGGDADIAGRALIVHEGADDYESQPSGEAGSRIACGVIGS